MSVDLKDRGYAAYPFMDFASGIVKALPRYTFDRAVIERRCGLKAGFRIVEAHLKAVGLTPKALCGFELRIPASLPLDAFFAFNDTYKAQLAAWDLMLENGDSPLARTNVSPTLYGSDEPSIHAFSYARPSEAHEASGEAFVVSGAPELLDKDLYPESIVARGDTSDAGLATKTQAAFDIVIGKMHDFGLQWDRRARVHLYAPRNLAGHLQRVIEAHIGEGPIEGVIWHEAAPPVPELELEIDVRRYSREYYLPT